MSGIVAEVLVALIVATSACYSLWRLGPRDIREAVLSLFGKVMPGLCSQRATPMSRCGACGGCDLATGRSVRARRADGGPEPR